MALSPHQPWPRVPGCPGTRGSRGVLRVELTLRPKRNLQSLAGKREGSVPGQGGLQNLSGSGSSGSVLVMNPWEMQRGTRTRCLAAGPHLSADASADSDGLSWPKGLLSHLFPSQHLLWRPWPVLAALTGGQDKGPAAQTLPGFALICPEPGLRLVRDNTFAPGQKYQPRCEDGAADGCLVPSMKAVHTTKFLLRVPPKAAREGARLRGRAWCFPRRHGLCSPSAALLDLLGGWPGKAGQEGPPAVCHGATAAEPPRLLQLQLPDRAGGSRS